MLHIQSGTANPKVYIDLTEAEVEKILEEWRQANALIVLKKTEDSIFIEAVRKE